MSSKELRMLAALLFAIGCLYGCSGASLFLPRIALVLAIVWIAYYAWLLRDAHTRRVPLAYDWPWLLVTTWPVSMAWYARRTQRSWRQCVALVVFPMTFFIGNGVGCLIRSVV